MNRKRTNRLVVILNIISIISIYILYFSTNYLTSNIIVENIIYNNFIIEIFVNNMQIILTLIHGGLGIINIICAIENKENKKICFWLLIFGICEIWFAVNLVNFINNSEFLEFGNKIVYGIIPILLAILNFALIKRNRPKVIQIISYILVIIFAILDLVGIIGSHWEIIAVIMQLIYIHYQDKNIVESNKRKIINILLYYVTQFILVFGLLILIICLLVMNKINNDKWKNQLSQLYNNITQLHGAKNSEIYIPVKNDSKYGFINEKGQEKIPCQYDRVTYFNEISINNFTYYIALVEKNNEFYIISKDNEKIVLENDLKKFMQNQDNITESIPQNQEFDSKENILAFELFLQVPINEVMIQKPKTDYIDNRVDLIEDDFKYYYKNKNYSMIIEPNYEEMENNETDYSEIEYDDDENTYYFPSSYDIKYNVTVIKSNGEESSNIVYLPGLNESELTLDLLTDGYVVFENEEKTRWGWYDNDGNKTVLPENYIIDDIRNNKIIMQLKNNEEDMVDDNKKVIVDMTGKMLLETTTLEIYNKVYLVKNSKNKMILMDSELNVISNEYDEIITLY